MAHYFTNDYDTLCHPRILKALEKYIDEQNIGYGLDVHSNNASRYIKDVFDLKHSDIHFLSGGTQTNMVFISSILKHYEGVICSKDGHINVHEAASIEGSGHKIIQVEGRDGKIYPEDIIKVMETYTNEHMVKPKMVYISNSTEIGTIYFKQELINLSEICRKYSLFLFIDGARLGSALTCKDNDVEPSLFGEICDAFYIGGTKNGLLFGEALAINNPSLQNDFRYAIKNKGAMLAKGFVAGIQFEEAFKDSLYFDIAKENNDKATYLRKGLQRIGVEVKGSPTNQIFISLPNDIANKVIERYRLEMWEKGDNHSLVRIVISLSTSKEDIEELITYLKKCRY